MKSLLALLTALLVSGFANAATLEEDVNRYVQVFSGGKHWHAEATESLAWMGISDQRVFDIVERLLNEDAQLARYNRYEKDRVAHYIRALGFSGQPKYVPTISKYLGDHIYERYARTALADMKSHQSWNAVISNRAAFDPNLSDDVNRILIMLRSADFDLKKIGAKRVYFKHKDEVLLAALATEVKASYAMNTPALTDAIAWMVKALGSAGQPAYRPLLEEVAAKSPNNKVADYAKKALEG